MDEENNILEKNELIPGIILIKELKQPENIYDPEVIGIFVYKIQLTKMNILNIEIDFSNSKYIKIKNTNTLKKIKVTVMPFETKIIAEILLEKDFKISPKFNFNLFIPEKKIQLKYIQKYIQEKEILYEKIVKEISKYPFEYMDLEEIDDILYNLNLNFIDIQFPQNDEALIKKNIKKSELNYIIHWRRPEEFLINENNKGNHYNNYNNNYYNDIKIFSRNECPFINDIKQSLFPTNNLDCVLNSLTEKNNLIKRLFRSTSINENGIYKIKLCIKGEWITVIIDDYFPCIPLSDPVVSSTFSNDLWVLLIQKALAKSFGNYYNLIRINIIQYLNILTGCPAKAYKISELIHNKNNIQNLYNKINQYLNEKKYLLIAVSKENNDDEDDENNGYLTIPGIGYTILDILNKNENIFIVLRINIFDKNIEKNSENYMQKLNKRYYSIIDNYKGNNNNNKDNILILNIEDFIKEFKSLIVCYTKKWEEVRIRGKFVNSGNDNDNNLNNIIISKCFYNIHLQTETNIIIGLFQDDDEFIFNKANSRKNTLDISLAIVKQDFESNEISLIKTLDFNCSSNIQIEINLTPGNYIIFPRTSGCLFGKIKNNNTQTIIYDSKTKKFSEVFINAVKDIFKKFDVLLNRYLGFKEFKGFWECVQNNKTINENFFNNNILNKYQSYMNGITEKGFIDFFKDNYLSKNGKEEINKWFNKLGYDKNLYPLKSRCFMITFHSEIPIKVSVFNSLETNLYTKIERLILMSNGKKIKELDDIIILQYRSSFSNIYSVGVINQGNKAYVIGIKTSKKKGYIFSDERNKVEKIVEPGKSEFFFYYYIGETENNSKKSGENNYNNTINFEIEYYLLP